MKTLKKDGFTLLEVLTVVAVLAILSVVFLWGSKDVYSKSRSTLVRDFAAKLNSKAEIYKMHILADGNGTKPHWQSLDEAIIAMNNPVPGTQIKVIEDTNLSKKAANKVIWDEKNQKFLANN